MTHAVRTTIRPDQELEVDDSEYAQLKADGLLVDEPAPELPAPAAPEKKNPSAAKSS